MGRLRILLFLLAAAALLAGCGSSSPAPKPKPKPNGEAAKSASVIYADAKRAAASASSVHATGNAGAQGTFDVSIDSSGAASGTFRAGSGRVDAILQGSELYLRGDSGFWASFGDVGLPLKRITDHWIRASAADPPFASLTSVLDWTKFISKLNLPGTLAKSGVHKFHGQQAVVLSDPSLNGTLYVSSTGKPYPLGIVAGGGSVTITFDHWDAAPRIPSPPKSAKPIFGH